MKSEKNVKLSGTTQGATPHHQPRASTTMQQSIRRSGGRGRGWRSHAQAERARAVRATERRRVGCGRSPTSSGWWWGAGSARHRSCGRMRVLTRCRRHRVPARPSRARVYPNRTPVANHSALRPAVFHPGCRHPRQQKAKPCPVVSIGACFPVRATCPPCCRSARD